MVDVEMITDEQIKEYKEKKCTDCDFAHTSYCTMLNDDVRLCITIDEPIPEI